MDKTYFWTLSVHVRCITVYPEAVSFYEDQTQLICITKCTNIWPKTPYSQLTIFVWSTFCNLANVVLIVFKVVFLMGKPLPHFAYFRSFQIHVYISIVDVSGIRTQIVGVEGEHADHLTTTMAQVFKVIGDIFLTKVAWIFDNFLATQYFAISYAKSFVFQWNRNHYSVLRNYPMLT